MAQHQLHRACTRQDATAHQQQHRSFSAKVVAVREGLKTGTPISREDLLSFPERLAGRTHHEHRQEAGCVHSARRSALDAASWQVDTAVRRGQSALLDNALHWVPPR
jgi:hypothetical protein